MRSRWPSASSFPAGRSNVRPWVRTVRCPATVCIEIRPSVWRPGIRDCAFNAVSTIRRSWYFRSVLAFRPEECLASRNSQVSTQAHSAEPDTIKLIGTAGRCQSPLPSVRTSMCADRRCALQQRLLHGCHWTGRSGPRSHARFIELRQSKSASLSFYEMGRRMPAPTSRRAAHRSASRTSHDRGSVRGCSRDICGHGPGGAVALARAGRRRPRSTAPLAAAISTLV